ncbi:hypothetical protein [Paraburkholderia sp. BL23I1N1]|uniref:hypothetical protein n=1 Tax=Paraburkholderia sp. BL23I1N1 TaxID=1938802 RepID=UPI001602590D|nr:hypothetical protein [Paraburkholderia sp. BL23I1N1]
MGAPSDVIAGGLGQKARRLLPRTPNPDYYGGEMTFTMAVDPVRQNYFTIKMWGSETSQSWLILNVNGYEVGGRRMTHDEEMLSNNNGWYPDRFIYRTVRIPLKLTTGQNHVTIKVRSVGFIAYYGPVNYDTYQKRMDAATVGIYSAYMHTTGYLDVSSEVQGSAPAATTKTTSSTDEANWLSGFKANVNKQLTSKMSTSPSSLTPNDLDYLARAYSVTWTTAYRNQAAVNQVVAGMDALVSAYAAAPTTYIGSHGNDSWGGYFGKSGNAIRLLWPQVRDLMAQTVNYGGSIGTTTRQTAWANALRASVDYGRFHRLVFANQEIYTTTSIYLANAGLLLVDSSQALLEQEARRYLYEGFGISPWLGSDQPGEGPVPVRGTSPNGPNWYQVTSRGTTKETCLVGGDYGEQGGAAFYLGQVIGDDQLKAQGIKMLRARAALRYPAVDSNGNLVSYVAEPIGCRNDWELNWHVAYLGHLGDPVLVGAAGAAVIGNDLMGYAQQAFGEGQLLGQLTVGGGGSDIVQFPDAYAAFRAQPTTGIVLPMTSGQPDFAWTDEENMVVAAKHGEERLWAVLDWTCSDAINNLAKIFVTTPQNARLAEVSLDDLRYTPAGYTVTRNGSVDNTPPHGRQPPDNPVLANIGDVLPAAMRPELAKVPPNNFDGGRGTGYTLRYGHWLIAINAHPTQTYTMRAPQGFTGGVDLVSGISMGATVTLQPKTSAVFYLGNTN